MDEKCVPTQDLSPTEFLLSQNTCEATFALLLVH